MTLQLDDTDPIPLVLERLRQDERVQALLDGGHISGIREEPWPCLVVEAGSDSVVSARGGMVNRGVSLVLYDSFEEAFGSWAARRLMLAAVQSLAAMEDEPAPADPTDPIVVGVITDASIYAMRSTAGQQRYMTDATFRMAAAQQPSEV